MCFLPGFVFLRLNKLNATDFETVKSLDKVSAEPEGSQGLICLIALEFHCKRFVYRNPELEMWMLDILNLPKQNSERSMVLNSTAIQAVGPHVSAPVGWLAWVWCCIHLMGRPPVCDWNTCRGSSGLFAEVVWSCQVRWFLCLDSKSCQHNTRRICILEYIQSVRSWGMPLPCSQWIGWAGFTRTHPVSGTSTAFAISRCLPKALYKCHCCKPVAGTYLEFCSLSMLLT